MTRVILALASILMLALSASLMHTQLRPMRFDARSASSVALQQNAGALQHNMLLDRETPAINAALSTNTGEEAPAPALLVYLTFILIGSAVAVGLVRHHLHHEV